VSLFDNEITGRIENYLDLAAKRQELIVSNMANVDTPGYRTRDLDFETELRRASDESHGALEPEIVDVEGLVQRPDGNNVNMDREGLLLAKTQLQFSIGAQLLKHQYQQLLEAIKEGNPTS
jgi:flagellar basal-body rod protein FlgB